MFNWGALVGFTAVTGYLSTSVLVLYLAGFFWTIGYDTIYAHQDKDDDMMVGLKSTAILFGNRTKAWLVVLYGLFAACLMVSGFLAGLNFTFVILMIPVGLHLVWQIYKLDIKDGDICHKIFLSNILFGGLVTAVLFISYLTLGVN